MPRLFFQVICLDENVFIPFVDALQQQIDAQLIYFDDQEAGFTKLRAVPEMGNVLLFNGLLEEASVTRYLKDFRRAQLITALISDNSDRFKEIQQLLLGRRFRAKTFSGGVSPEEVVEYFCAESEIEPKNSDLPVTKASPEIDKLCDQKNSSKTTPEHLGVESSEQLPYFIRSNSNMAGSPTQQAQDLTQSAAHSKVATQQPDSKNQDKNTRLNISPQALESISDIPQTDRRATRIIVVPQKKSRIAQLQQVRIEQENQSYANQKNTIPKELICGICLEPFRKPVRLECGHTFCMRCLALCEKQQYKQCLGTDTQFHFQCPHGEFNVGGEWEQCGLEYEKAPGVDVETLEKIKKYIPARELGDKEWAVLFDEEPVQLVERIEIKGFKNYSIPTLGVVLTVGGERIRTEMTNLEPLSQNDTALSTRTFLGDLVIQHQRKQSPNPHVQEICGPRAGMEYHEELLKFQVFQPERLNSTAPIRRLLGFQNGEFVLEDKLGAQTRETSLDKYFTIKLHRPSAQYCQGCGELPRLSVKTQCGCQYCAYCFARLARSGLRCFGCGGVLRMMETCPEIESFTASDFVEVDSVVVYKEQMCLVIHQLSGEYFVVQQPSGRLVAAERAEITPIDIRQMDLAPRPGTGDLCVYLSPSLQYCLGLVNQQGLLVSNFFSRKLTETNVCVKTLRLIRKITEPRPDVCRFCYQSLRRPMQLACGAVVCRYCCGVMSSLGLPCRACQKKHCFKAAMPLSDDQVDVGSLCRRKSCRVAAELFGFVRAIKEDMFEVALSAQQIHVHGEELDFIPANALVVKGTLLQEHRPAALGVICDHPNLDGMAAIVLAANSDGTFTVLTEIGATLDSVKLYEATVGGGPRAEASRFLKRR